MFKPKKIPVLIAIFGWASFFTDVSSEIIFPLLPAFVITQLGGTAFILGMIEGISEMTSSFLKLISGKFSDHSSQKTKWVFWGYSISSLMRSLVVFAPHWGAVLFLRFADRVGKGIRTSPRDTLITESIAKEDYGRAFGFHRMMDHAGAFTGSLIGAALIWFFPGQYRLVFCAAIPPALLACLILKAAQKYEPTSEKKFTPENKKIARTILPKRIKIFLFLLTLFNFGGATDAFILLKLQTSGVPIPLLPVIWAGFHAIKSFSTAQIGKLSDKVTRGRFVAIGWFVYAGIFALFALHLPLTGQIIVFLLYGIFYGFTEAPEKALISNWTPAGQRGTALGWYHFLVGISLLPASLLFGWIWDKWGSGTAFRCAATTSFLAALLLATFLGLMTRQKKNPNFRASLDV